jgi:S-adenosylmethionine:tRNA ribosyltransferase-isomerase
VRIADFDYYLPPDLIAQRPLPQRDQSRLLVLRREDRKISHRRFLDLPGLLRPSDVLVLNDSRVIPARLFGTKPGSSGKVELLLLEENGTNDWWTMARPGKRSRIGASIELLDQNNRPSGIVAQIVEKNVEGHCRVRFEGTADILQALATIGVIPLPPYIHRSQEGNSDEDRDRYQTIYAQPPGSVAAPTAGLHFTKQLFADLRARSVKICFVTLHVGLGTFAPVKSDRLEEHIMHSERFQIGDDTAAVINTARQDGGRVVAVGTTTVRVLEAVAAAHEGRLVGSEGTTRIFIRPPARFRVVDVLLTNFHLPRSTLLTLVSAFAAPGELRGREMVLDAYAEAIRERYRFFSYGDSMLII